MPIAFVMSSPSKIEPPSVTGSRMVCADGRELPLTGAHVRASARGGLARTVVEQRFRNPYPEALTVTYSLPLPADGAVSGFAFELAGRRIAGEVARRDEARERFEEAVLHGRSAALLEQDRSSLFTQEIGNIPPGATIVAEITVDQPLAWLDEGAWEWRFPTVVAPRYLGEPGRVRDAERVAQDVADGPIAARFTLACEIEDELAPGRRPESPSHRTAVIAEGTPSSYRENGAGRAGASGGITAVRIDEGARLDRDIVVRWAVATPRVGLSLAVGRPGRGGAEDSGYGLLTIVPPARGKGGEPVARDVIVLLDTSGSMGGSPLDQARRVVSAIVDTMGERDRLEMIEFSSRASRWRRKPTAMDDAGKRAAMEWVRGLSAGGSTEMRTGILEALGGAREDAQRQVILVTDGQIGFETEVIAAICDRLPVSSRLHTVGIGSAVNRSLTGPAARAGRGVEVIVGLGEDPERAAKRLVERTDAPIVVNLSISGSAVIEHAPRRLPDLFAAAPTLAGLRLRPEGGEIVARGRTAAGPWEQRLSVDPIAKETGSRAVVALHGRQIVEDAEMEIAAGKPRAERERLIESTGLAFQIATRLTSWVAVTEEITVDPERDRRRERVPHELPFGMSAEGAGLRGAEDALESKAMFSLGALAAMPASRPSAPMRLEVPMAALPARSRKGGLGGAWLFLAFLAFGVAYYVTRSFWVSLGVYFAVGFLVVSAALVLRRWK